jgi:putative transposase
MARSLRIQFAGAFYHVTCRGNKRRNIFLDDADRRRFLELLSESLKIYGVVLYAYVMMNNHFHLVIRTTRANLSEFMRRFNISYTAWVNYHHDTCGHLYQGRYHAIVVDADNYLLELTRYVHLNPTRIRSLRKKYDHRRQWQYVERYRWSSLPGYVRTRNAVDFVDYDMLLEMIGGRQEYRQFLLEGIRNPACNPFADVKHQTILGEIDFVEHIKNKYLDVASLREQPRGRDMITEVIPPASVLERVAEYLGVDARTLSMRQGNGINRGITAELLHRYSGLSQQEIGKLLGGIDYTAVSMLRSRLRFRMQKDPGIRAEYEGAERSLRSL